MTEWRNAPGQIEAIIYFVNQQGKVVIAPHVDHPTPQGFERKECRTLAEVDVLTRRMNAQDEHEFNLLFAKDREIMAERREKTRTKLRQRMLAADCLAFERRFIQGALEYLDRKEKENTEFRIRGYFHQREFDRPENDPIDKYGEQVKMPKMSDRLAALLTK